MSRAIQWAGRGQYSHAAMASWRDKPANSLLECVEFREWKGGRTVALSTQVAALSGQIDVFRVSSRVEEIQLQKLGTGVEIQSAWVDYDGKAATEVMRELTGLPYGWHRIWLLGRESLPLIRFFFTPNFEDKSENGGLYPVCSTAVAAAIRRKFVDLMPNLSDNEMSPSDLGRCRDLHYLFTLVDE